MDLNMGNALRLIFQVIIKFHQRISVVEDDVATFFPDQVNLQDRYRMGCELM